MVSTGTASEATADRGRLPAATSDRRQVARWWQEWPRANIGVPAGGDWMDVVDVDRHRSGTGIRGARTRPVGRADQRMGRNRAEASTSTTPLTRRARRGRARWGEAQVDFRGVGSYVLVPPSRVVTVDGEVGGYALIAVGSDPQPIDGDGLRAFLRPRPARSARFGSAAALPTSTLGSTPATPTMRPPKPTPMTASSSPAIATPST